MTGACKGGGHGGAMPTPPTTMPERVRLGRTFCGHLAVADVGGVEYVRADVAEVEHDRLGIENKNLRNGIRIAIRAINRLTNDRHAKISTVTSSMRAERDALRAQVAVAVAVLEPLAAFAVEHGVMKREAAIARELIEHHQQAEGPALAPAWDDVAEHITVSGTEGREAGDV